MASCNFSPVFRCPTHDPRVLVFITEYLLPSFCHLLNQIHNNELQAMLSVCLAPDATAAVVPLDMACVKEPDDRLSYPKFGILFVGRQAVCKGASSPVACLCATL